MPDAFDPYHVWLGIPKPDQPPHYYRLLAITPLEDSPEVIEHAADRQMAHLRSLALGEHAELSQKLLNEIAAARVCLLNPDKKAAYDEQLKADLRAEEQPVAPPPPAPPAAKPAPVPYIDTEPPFRRAVANIRNTPQLQLWIAIGAAATVLLAVIVVVGVRMMQSGGSTARDAPDTTRQFVQAEDELQPETPTSPVEQVPDRPVHDGRAGPGPFEPSAPDGSDPEPPIAPQRGPAAVDPEPEPTTPPGPDPQPPVEPAPPPDPQPEEGPDPLAEPRLPLGVRPPDEPEPVAPEPARLAIPDAPARREAEARIKRVFAGDYAAVRGPTEQVALAEKLLEEGVQTADDPLARYVLLREAADLALSAGAVETAWRAVDQLAQFYQLEPIAEKRAMLIALGRAARRPSDHRQLTMHYLTLAGRAAAEGDYEQASALAASAAAAARKSGDPSLQANTRLAARDAKEILARARRVEAAAGVLAENPNDAAANGETGRFYSFLLGDWPRGLPLLARSDDPAEASAAAGDLIRSGDPSEQSRTADRWWQLAETQSGLAASQIRLRAAYWYRAALPGLTGINKTEAEKRLQQAEGITLLAFQPRHESTSSQGDEAAGPAVLKTVQVSARTLIGLAIFKLPAAASTGIELQQGREVTLRTSGRWKIGLRPADLRGPEPMRIAVGQVGRPAIQSLKGAPVVRFTVKQTGILFLGIDDLIPADNSGELTVDVEIR